MPRLSVLIPSARGGELLRQAVESVLTQGYRDFELLVSDDGADGSVGRTVGAFKDSRLRLIEGPRQGQIANSQHLWAQAGGELVHFLHDDDYFLPGALEAQVEALDAAPQAAFAFIQRKLLYPEGPPRGDFPDKPNQIYRPATVVRSLLATVDNPIGEPSCSMFRRASLEQVQSYRGFPIRSMIDVSMYLQASETGAAIGVHRYLAVVRRHPNQFSRSSPFRSAGVFEWELFIRSELDLGRLSPADALAGIKVLTPFYHRSKSHQADVAAFLPGLERLERDLRADRPGPYVDADYRETWDQASAIIEARAAAQRDPAAAARPPG